MQLCSELGGVGQKFGRRMFDPYLGSTERVEFGKCLGPDCLLDISTIKAEISAKMIGSGREKECETNTRLLVSFAAC